MTKINLTEINELVKEGDKHNEWILAMLSSMLSDMAEVGNNLLRIKTIVDEHKKFILSKEAEFAGKVGVKLEGGYFIN